MTKSTNPPDPEVRPRATRRRFSTNYKLEILRQAEQCGASIGAEKGFSLPSVEMA